MHKEHPKQYHIVSGGVTRWALRTTARQQPSTFCPSLHRIQRHSVPNTVYLHRNTVCLHWLVHTSVHTHRHSLYFSLSLSLHTLSLYTHMLYGEGVEGADTQDDGEEARTGGGEGRDAGEQRGH